MTPLGSRSPPAGYTRPSHHSCTHATPLPFSMCDPPAERCKWPPPRSTLHASLAKPHVAHALANSPPSPRVCSAIGLPHACSAHYRAPCKQLHYPRCKANCSTSRNAHIHHRAVSCTHPHHTPPRWELVYTTSPLGTPSAAEAILMPLSADPGRGETEAPMWRATRSPCGGVCSGGQVR